MTPVAGEPLTFNGDGIDDSAVALYSWHSDIDGWLYNGSKKKFMTGNLSGGTHNITLQLTDDDGFTGMTRKKMFTVESRPVATIVSIIPRNSTEDRRVKLNGSGSDDGIIVGYSWTSSIDGPFYNGTSSSILRSTLSNGTHEISLIVMDDAGLWSGPVTQNMTVNGRPRVHLDQMVQDGQTAGSEVTFVAIFEDDGTVDRYLWNSSIDGNFYDGPKRFFYYTHLSHGIHDISVVGVDDNGAWSDTSWGELTILVAPNMFPTASIGSIEPDPVMETMNVTFAGEGTDTDGNVTHYKWTSDVDGKLYMGSAPTLTINNLSVGHHNISLTVMDNEGSWSSPDTATLLVEPLRMTAVIVDMSPNPAWHNERVILTGKGLYDNITWYRWNSSLDGTLGSTTGPVWGEFVRLELSNGTHVISLEVGNETGHWSDPVYANLTILNETTAHPDMVIATEDLSIWPSSPVEGEDIIIGIKVSNTGYADVKNIPVILEIGGLKVQERKVTISRGGSANVSFTLSFQEGSWEIAIVVDPGNQVGELSESNNQVDATISVGEKIESEDKAEDDQFGVLIVGVVLFIVLLIILALMSRSRKKAKKLAKTAPPPDEKARPPVKRVKRPVGASPPRRKVVKPRHGGTAPLHGTGSEPADRPAPLRPRKVRKPAPKAMPKPEEKPPSERSPFERPAGETPPPDRKTEVAGMGAPPPTLTAEVPGPIVAPPAVPPEEPPETLDKVTTEPPEPADEPPKPETKGAEEPSKPTPEKCPVCHGHLKPGDTVCGDCGATIG
jgi:hypothetical protein